MTAVHRIPYRRLQFAVFPLPEHEQGGRPSQLDDRAMQPYVDELQTQFPTSLDGMRVVGWRGSRVLVACACPPALIAEGGKAILVTPDELPTFVFDSLQREQEPHRITPDDMNFLIGDAEPQEIVTLRRRRVHAVGLSVCASLALLLVGTERFAAAHQRAARDAMSHHNTLAQATIGESLVINDEVNMADVARLQAKLMQERDTLLLTRAPRVLPPQPRDATQSLASLLVVWPTIAPADVSNAPVLQTTSLAVAPDAITASVTTTVDAREFLDRLKAPAGWELAPPRLRQGVDGTLLSLQLRPLAQEASR
ncbi:MAG: hypothetical protein ACK5ZG_13430 [Phycisphaerae bacterium]